MIQLDLPLQSLVFLTNRQQDLEMLNSTKLTFLDTLYSCPLIAIYQQPVQSFQNLVLPGSSWRYFQFDAGKNSYLIQTSQE